MTRRLVLLLFAVLANLRVVIAQQPPNPIVQITTSAAVLPPPVLKDNGGIYRETNFDLDLLAYNYTRPPDNPAAPGDTFNPTLTGSVARRTPVVSEFTRQASPDRSFVLHGSTFTARTGAAAESDIRVLLYSQTTANSNATLWSAQLLREDIGSLTAYVPNSVPYGMYLVWPENQNGAGRPIRVNATEAWWVGPNHGVAGASISVYGRNLSKDNSTVTSSVFIRPWGSGSGTASTVCTVSSVNPYKVTFTIPRVRTNADYEVWIHNNHGGEYGWSGPLKLRVEASNPYTWAGTRRSVTSFGAVANDGLDDTSAFQAAFNASADGDIVTIPAGTFTLTGSDQLHINAAIDINGAGIARTTIDITATTWCCQGVFKVNDLPTRIRNMRFNSSITGGLSQGIIFFDGFNQTPTRAGAIVDSVAFFTPNAATSKYRCIDTRSVNDLIVRNSEFRSSQAIRLYIVFQAFIHNNTIDGNWPEADASPGTVAITALRSHEMDISNNLGRSLNRARGSILCRLWLTQGAFQSTTSHHYLGSNETQSTGCRVGTCGEHILFESAGTYFTGSPTNVGSNTLAFSGTPFAASRFVWDDSTSWQDPSTANPAVALIQSGPGAGQYRRITANTSSQLTLDRPWDIAPDTTSVITIGNASCRSAVYSNKLTGDSQLFTAPDDLYNAGVETFGTVMDLVVANNTISTTTTGVQISALVNNSCVAGAGGSSMTNGCPNWNVTVTGNTITDVKYGVTSWSRIENPDRTADLLLNLNKIADNIISTSRNHALSVGDINLYGVDRIWQQSAVVEHNSVTNAQRYVILLGLQGGTVVRNNAFADTDLYSGTIGIDFSAFSHEPYLYSNSYGGTIDTLYGDTPPAGILQVLERSVPFEVIRPASSTRTIVVRNVGTDSLSVSVSDNAPWLTAGLSQSTIADENSSSDLTITVNPRGLAGGTYTGAVTVSREKQIGITLTIKPFAP
jgi:Pectate lyase superfamily protein/Viral BACON domain